VVCCQEVSRFDPAIDGDGADQVTMLEALFSGYRAFFGAALDRAGGRLGRRRQFGNLVLTRLPALHAFRHHLPQPAAGGIKHMPRQATEVVVETRAGPLRVVTTHLEYYLADHRAAQIERLRALHAETSANAKVPPKPAKSPYDPMPRPASMVLCGDFNVLPDDNEYRALFAPFADGTPALLDAWRLRHGAHAHPPTCGLFDRAQWAEGGHCRDYFAVTPDVAGRLVTMEADLKTDASDHQPVRLELAD
jgi:endonuclease/exonuclease/phosphatase family metal-dependent hydrolase